MNYLGIASPSNFAHAGTYSLVDGGNDDPSAAAGVPDVILWGNYSLGHAVFIAAGGFQDMMLALALGGTGTENCDGNVWKVTWQFEVG